MAAPYDKDAADSAQRMLDAAAGEPDEKTAKALERAGRRYFWKSLGMERGPSKPQGGRP
jgi:hypothetical protein